MQVHWNKGKCFIQKKVQLSQHWFGTPTWLPFYVLGQQYGECDVMWKRSRDRFQSRDQQLWKFLETKENL